MNQGETGSSACQMQHSILIIALKINFHSGGLECGCHVLGSAPGLRPSVFM